MAKACTRKRVVIKSKRTGKEIANFMAHRGSNCPKPKRKTGHLREFKQIFAIEAKACAKRQGKKWSRKNYNACIKQGMKTAFHGR